MHSWLTPFRSANQFTNHEAIVLFWLLFVIYLTFHYPCVLLLKGIYYKNTFKSNRNSITKYFFGHFVWYFHWLCDFYYNMRSVRFDANCAKSHKRTTSEGLNNALTQSLPTRSHLSWWVKSYQASRVSVRPDWSTLKSVPRLSQAL